MEAKVTVAVPKAVTLGMVKLKEPVAVVGAMTIVKEDAIVSGVAIKAVSVVIIGGVGSGHRSSDRTPSGYQSNHKYGENQTDSNSHRSSDRSHNGGQGARIVYTSSGSSLSGDQFNHSRRRTPSDRRVAANNTETVGVVIMEITAHITFHGYRFL
ncbi:hypothetical protein QAD02_011101 [Eretmocerus hayati]|uniref:Uncharacterized protein n=1 Tax=Eretmocerus hayati TaxID=131215 RepID=A0ACC2P0J6_9HYME|nr:hypothetical protein QAD02_011101 [Eretmocerus hayati]